MDQLNLKGYNGDPRLKKSNQSIDWTPELVAEYVKCSEDPIYFTETYMRVIHVDHGLVPFKLYDYQKTMLQSMHDNRFSIIATARQVGKSTTTCAFILWYILFNADKTVALLANKGETAREILGKVQLAYRNLPRWLQQGVIEWNKGSFELENGSRVLASATSADSIRGYAINLLFIDEAAFIENWDEFFTSTFPTVSSGKTTKVVLVSTPNGLNHFWKTWDLAEKGENEYTPIKVMWHEVPGRDEEWKKTTLAGMNFDLEKFAQEYEVEFMGSSGTLIAGWKLKELSPQIPLFDKGGFKTYEMPKPGHNYVIVADVSEGKGFDYSAFSVTDVTSMPYKQVAVFRSNMVSYAEYTEIIYNTAVQFNRAACLVEVNNIGVTVADLLYQEYEYENILFTESAGARGKKISTGYGKSVDRGVRTTITVKAVGCSLLKLLIESNQYIVNDYETIFELSRFSRKNRSFEAEPGCNDDLVMGLVLFAWLTDQKYFRELTDINTVQRLREKTEEEIMSEILPFGFIEDGQPDEEPLPPAGQSWMDF